MVGACGCSLLYVNACLLSIEQLVCTGHECVHACTHMHQSSDYSYSGLKMHWTAAERVLQPCNRQIALRICAVSCTLNTARRLLISQLQKASILLLNYASQTVPLDGWDDPNGWRLTVNPPSCKCMSCGTYPSATPACIRICNLPFIC